MSDRQQKLQSWIDVNKNRTFQELIESAVGTSLPADLVAAMPLDQTLGQWVTTLGPDIEEFGDSALY